jgi:hypothetical protein
MVIKNKFPFFFSRDFFSISQEAIILLNSFQTHGRTNKRRPQQRQARLHLGKPFSQPEYEGCPGCHDNSLSRPRSPHAHVCRSPHKGDPPPPPPHPSGWRPGGRASRGEARGDSREATPRDASRGQGSSLTFARLRRLVRRPSGVSAIPVSMGVAEPGTAVGPA